MDEELTYLRVGMKEAKNYNVIDENGKRIPLVQWADTEKQLFQVVIADKEGKLIMDSEGCIQTRIKKGKIKLVRKPEKSKEETNE